MKGFPIRSFVLLCDASMRGWHRMLALLLFATAFSQPLLAQTTPYVRTIASHLVIESFDVLNWQTKCPAGHVPLAYSIIRGHVYDEDELQAFDLIDANGSPFDRNALPGIGALAGGGYSVLLYNTEHHLKDFGVVATCLSLAALGGEGAVTLARASGTAPAGGVGVVNSFCPPEFPAAIAGFSSANNIAAQEVGSAPVWGTSAAAQALANVPDGQTGAPTGWQVKVYNFGAAAPAVAYAICTNVPGVQTFVYSAPIVISFTSGFNVVGVVPDGWTGAGAGFDTGSFAFPVATNVWVQDGTVADAQQWFPNSTLYDSGTAPARGFMFRSIRTAIKPGTGASPRATMAVVAVPQAAAPPPPTRIDIVEFYNAALDHYFITGFPQEISDLDTGVHKGWARTGEGFKAYGIGSTGNTARRPVCREYGLPSQGLNSHFYSASPDECFNTLSNLGAWGLEASEVFEMDLPDSVTGACPAGDIPVYRVWNQRYDSNHRYTTNTAIRDQMVQKGGVAEGYGPSAVALCALP